jgi:hypothetical protein
MRPIPSITIAVTLLGLAACRPAQQAGPSPVRISHAFSPVCDPRVGIMRGNLAEAQRAARELADHCTVQNAPSALATDVATVTDLANRVATAPDLAAAARTTALLGNACGSCHLASSATITLAVVTTPVPGDGPTSTQMRRHYWASERLWEGLIGPADDNWSRGAAALRDPTAYANIVAAGTASPQTIERIAARLAEVGTRAQTAQGADRVAVYGEYLGACADCHTRIRGAGF